MFKRITLVLLSLNLLMPKLVVAFEPISTCIILPYALSSLNSYLAVGTVVLSAQRIKNMKPKEDNGFKAQAKLALEEHGYIMVANSLEKIKAEEIFRKCLISNRNNFDLGSSGIPKVCEDSAKILRLLGRGAEVDELVADFSK